MVERIDKSRIAGLSGTDLDDQALGALLRKKLILFKTAAEQMDRTITMTAALLLCCDASEAGATEVTVSLEGVTQGGREFGDWRVVAMRMPIQAHGTSHDKER